MALELKNWGEAKEHLLQVMDAFSDDEKSKVNPSFTKEHFWNLIMGIGIEKNDADEIEENTLRNIMTEFPEYLRDDFNPKQQ